MEIIMMKKAITLAVLTTVAACSNDTTSNNTTETAQATTTAATPVVYPTTKKGDVVDSYFEQKVADPYRWLEDDRSEETALWVESQNEVTFNYLSRIPYRNQLKERLTKLMDYEKVGAPFKEGKYTYFYKNDGLQNQYVLYRQLGEGEPEVFLDPNSFSADGTTSLAGITFSKDGSLAAYQISEGGSDWRKVIIIDVESKKQIEDTLVDIKFSGLSWQGNEVFTIKL